MAKLMVGLWPDRWLALGSNWWLVDVWLAGGRLMAWVAGLLLSGWPIGN
jgi:hypothetical protein